MSSDLRCKRAILFEKVHELMQKFGQVDPTLMVKLVSVYGTALYGSNLWQLSSEEYQKLCRSWNTVIRIVWGLPHNAHKKFIESLSPVPHLQSVLAGRYVGFLQSLETSENLILNLLFKSCKDNLATQTGHNICHLMKSYNVSRFDELLAHRSVIKSSRIYLLDDAEKWKIGLIGDIARILKGISSFDILEDDELISILKSVCTD